MGSGGAALSGLGTLPIPWAPLTLTDETPSLLGFMTETLEEEDEDEGKTPPVSQGTHETLGLRNPSPASAAAAPA